MRVWPWLAVISMYELTETDLIWNRACEGGGSNPRRGDRALAALIRAHGLAMNGGVLHAVECLSKPELLDAESGYRFFGFGSVADLIRRARQFSEADTRSGRATGLLSRIRRLFRAADDLETQESQLDSEYAALIPDDSVLLERFQEHWRTHASDFAPL